MAKHPYLSFSESSYSYGKVVGTSNFTVIGNGLTKKSIKIVQIPPVFDDKCVVEIGFASFRYTTITSVFISKNVQYINWGAFESSEISEVRFEEGSRLERINDAAFLYCKSLKKIDFPSSLQEIMNRGYGIFGQNILDCVSYHGIHDFSSMDMYKSSLVVHVSSKYSYDIFGKVKVTKDDQTCGISNQLFFPTRLMHCSPNIRYQCRTNLFLYTTFLLS